MDNQIRALRKALGLSQEELAKACGVSRQTINAIENNKYDPTLALAFHLPNHPGRKYKEVFFSLGGTQSAVYATEVSLEEYYTYTTEESEKMELFALADKLGGNLELAIKRLAESKRNPQSSTT